MRFTLYKFSLRSLFGRDVTELIIGLTRRVLSALCVFFTFFQILSSVDSKGVAAVSFLQTIVGWVAILELGAGFLTQDFIVKPAVDKADVHPNQRRLLMSPFNLSAAVLFVAFCWAWFKSVTGGNLATIFYEIPAHPEYF